MNTSDSATTVDELRQLVKRFVDERDWNSFHNPKNLAMSLAIEAGELMEHFQWLTLDEAALIANDPQQKHDVGEEVSDCLAYILSLANAMDIDLSESLRAKMIRNAEKYPRPQ
tara:strand:+ start:73120 stop:73458 length:339 start_codon:yes stop_codon:yes gene_type:complete